MSNNKHLTLDGQTVKTHDGKLILGHVSKNSFGWTFIPACAGRRSSRNSWPTPEAAIPAWAKRVAKRYKETGSIGQGARST